MPTRNWMLWLSLRLQSSMRSAQSADLHAHAFTHDHITPPPAHRHICQPCHPPPGPTSHDSPRRIPPASKWMAWRSIPSNLCMHFIVPRNYVAIALSGRPRPTILTEPVNPCWTSLQPKIQQRNACTANFLFYESTGCYVLTPPWTHPSTGACWRPQSGSYVGIDGKSRPASCGMRMHGRMSAHVCNASFGPSRWVMRARRAPKYESMTHVQSSIGTCVDAGSTMCISTAVESGGTAPPARQPAATRMPTRYQWE